jgi:hypothetical protein
VSKRGQGPRWRALPLLLVALVGLVGLVALAGCGGKEEAAPDIVEAGQLDIKLPPGWKVVDGHAVAPGGGAKGDVATPAGASGTTIPLAKQDPTTAFFQATSKFTSCLKGLGVKFVGAPDPKNPSSPANDPNYLKSLQTCASQSNIVQALGEFQKSQNDLTPKQIQDQNKAYLRWRKCMIGRGWKIPEPTPDSKGRLFSIGTGGGPQLTPPPGEDLLNSSDIQACATQSQAKTSKG